MSALGARSGGAGVSACPFDLCDGSGLLYDEATNTAYDCRCRPQLIALAKARSLSAVIPRRYRDVGVRSLSGDRDRPGRSWRPRAASPTRSTTHLDAGRGLWFMGPVGTGKTTLAMLVSKAALKAGRSVAIYSLPRLLNEIRDTHRAERSHVDLLDRLTAVDLLHIDDVGRRADDRLGARGALLDRQRALRGPALDGDHHQHPRPRGAVRADHRAHRLAADRDVRRAAAARPRPADGSAHA